MTETRQHRSVSQINSFQKCGWAYKLERIDKVWQRPAAWLGQGSAVHEAAEAWEKSNRTMTLAEAQDIFRESYALHINKACEEQASNLRFWFSSGQYHGEVDIERRYEIGLEQVEKLINWHLAHADQEIWVAPDGTRAIELAFDIILDDVPVRGYIDAVRVVGGELQVVDYKTGVNPGDDFQLAVYAIAIAEQFGVEQPKSGVYFMTGKKGKPANPTYPYDLTSWTREKVSARFQELESKIALGEFEPKPEPSKCRMCSVALSCEFSAA